MELPNSFARYAAVGALAVTFVVIIVLIGSSLGGDSGDDSASGGGGKANAGKQAKQNNGGGGGEDRKVYVVKPGDCCLSQIAQKTGIDIEELEQLNPGLDPQAIHSGDRVKLR